MRNIKDIEKCLREIEQNEKLGNSDLRVSELQSIHKLKGGYRDLGDTFLTDMKRLGALSSRHARAAINSTLPLDSLFEMLKSISRLEQCTLPEAKMTIKTSILCFVLVLRFLRNSCDEKRMKYFQAFRERCDAELPEDNIFREVVHSDAYGEQLEERLMLEIKTLINSRMEPWVRHYSEVNRYMETIKSAGTESSEDITALIDAINNAHKVLKLKAPQEAKAILVWMLRERIKRFMYRSDSSLASELFNRRNAMSKDNLLRNYIAYYYLQNGAIAKYEGVGVFEELFENLCREHGEEQILTWDAGEEDRRWEDDLPKIMKEALAKDELEQETRFQSICEVVNKREELKASRGITEDEATALLTEDEQALLREIGYAKI